MFAHFSMWFMDFIFGAHYRVEGSIFSFAAPQLHGRVVDFGVTENFCVTCACWGGDVIDFDVVMCTCILWVELKVFLDFI